MSDRPLVSASAALTPSAAADVDNDPSQEQLQQLLRDDVTLSDSARRRALELAPQFK